MSMKTPASRPQRIAMLTYSTKPRGGVVHALNLAEALAARGHHVEVFSIAKQQGTEFFRPLKVKAHVYAYKPPSGDFPTPEARAVANVERMIAKYIERLPADFDIYHTQDCVGAVALARMKKSGRIKAPTVRTIHHVDIFNEYRLEKFQQESIHDCDVKLAVSKYWQKWLRDNHGIAAGITYNGIHAARFEEADGASIRRKHCPRKEPMVLFVGGLEPRKGLEYLIMAMEQVVKDKRYSRAKLVAVAKAGLIERGENEWFRMLVQRLRLGNNVDLLGDVAEDDIPKYYAACDIYAMPSRMEGWGLGLMEAMAAGKPAIGTNAGGIPELLRHGKNGLLVEPADIGGLASAIKQLLGSRALRARLGAGGRKTVKGYTWEKAAMDAEKAYGGLPA